MSITTSSSRRKPKIVIVGAGSLFFGRQVIWAANNLAGLQGCTLALVDNDPNHLESMFQLAQVEAKFSNSGTKIEAYLDYAPALPGADFVVLSFSDRNICGGTCECGAAAFLNRLYWPAGHISCTRASNSFVNRL